MKDWVLARRGIRTLLAAALVLGCGEGPPQRVADESTARSTPSRAPAVAERPGPLASRHEAQESFDRARAALVRKDYRTSASALSDAVAFMRAHAAEAKTGAIAALQGSAKELEVLVERLGRGEAVTTRSYDRVVANAHRAEAQHHLTRAVATLADRAYPTAGEELVMTVDHLERTARELRRPDDPGAARALADARALAVRMVEGGVPPRADIKRVTAQLEAEIRRLCGIIDVEARACAVEAARQ